MVASASVNANEQQERTVVCRIVILTPLLEDGRRGRRSGRRLLDRRRGCGGRGRGCGRRRRGRRTRRRARRRRLTAGGGRGRLLGVVGGLLRGARGFAFLLLLDAIEALLLFLDLVLRLGDVRLRGV